MAGTSPNDVIARYGSFYRGDDDLFAHCLVRRSGQSVLLFQGLQTVTVRLFDPEGPTAHEIAVYGVQPGDPRPPGEYYAAPADSEVGKLVKEIAKID